MPGFTRQLVSKYSTLNGSLLKMFVGHPILDEIRQGCRLRPTKTVDKSKPIILVEGESLSPLLSQRRDPSPSTTPLPPLPAVDVPPQPPPAGVPPPPPTVKKQHLKPVTNPALLKLGGKTEVNRDELMKAIRGGVRLRKVVTNDKSAPVIEEYEGVTRSRSSRGSSPSCNEYQSDDAYESAQSSLSPLSTSPDSRGYRSEMGTLQQNHLQRCEESGTVTARPGFAVRSAPFNDEPHYAVPTVALPPPPPPPPPPVWAPQSNATVNGAPKLQNIHNGNEVMASGSEMAVDGTLQKPKKADEHYTSPIPTREMIEAEIPAGCAANRIKFLNSIQSRAQSESPVRQLSRPTIQRKLQSDNFQAPQQSQQTTGTTSADSSNGAAGSLGRTLTNRSLNDVNSIKKIAQRFDNKIANDETNMNKSNGVYQRPLHMSVSNGNFQTISADSPANIMSPTDGTQRAIPGKWMPPPRSLIANKQQPSQNNQDGKTYKPAARQFSLPKTAVEETSLSNVSSVPPKLATNRTVSQRWPPEQPSVEKTTSTAPKLSIINSEQTRNRMNDCSRLSDGERQPQASQEGGVAFFKSQLAQTGNDSQCAAASVQKSTSPLQRPSSPSTARSSSPIRRVAFPARFASSQAHPASVAARRSSFERISSPVPFTAENSMTRRAATPTLRSQSPALRNASPVPRYATAQTGESNLPTAQYAQVHQVAPAPHTAQNTPVQRMYASTHGASVADTVASSEQSSICMEPTAATFLSANTSVAAGGQMSPRSTELSILPPTATAPVAAISRNVDSIYATPIEINTNELPPPVPTTEPPTEHQIPVQL
ncbi:unnamed protein product, partial [Toxocara canis]|uniref:WH2 domain-containing protein n=1 Tax=Toxocara canis TaxID=6265 RepID=A0A183U2K0_TOXCA